MHNNLITINGQKMGKSLGNAINLEELFTGKHELLEKAYSPVSIRFFMLQAHYRSTLDFSNDALQASEKGLDRLFEGMENLDKIAPSESSSFDPATIESRFYDAMNDDLNTPVAVSVLFDGIRSINSAVAGDTAITAEDISKLREIYQVCVHQVLGLEKFHDKQSGASLQSELVELLINMRRDARERKDFAAADRIRDDLGAMGIILKDSPEGTQWSTERKD
jgi:cysteinyl-tRNA synthetase